MAAAAAGEEGVGKKMPETAKSTKASAKAETAAGRSPQAGTEGDGAAAISRVRIRVVGGRRGLRRNLEMGCGPPPYKKSWGTD